MPLVSMPVKKSRARGRDGVGSSKSLQKALRILLHLGRNGPEMGITQLAAALSLNKTTVYRLLKAMEKFALIEKNPTSERYRLGLKLHELGCRAVESRTLRTEAHRFLLELSRRSQESVSLAVPGAGGVMCLDRVDSENSVITVRTLVGGHFHAHSTAAGKAVLAYLPEAAAEAILDHNPLQRFTPATLTRISEVKRDLRLIRRRGYALDQEELERGLSAVAVPVLLHESDLVAAVGIAGPTPRFRGKELSRKIAMAKDTAAKISAALGERGSALTGAVN